jgi:hypothetical protein
MGMFAYITVNGITIDAYNGFTAFKQTYIRNKKTGFPKLMVKYKCNSGYGFVKLQVVIAKKDGIGVITRTIEGHYDEKHKDIRGYGTINLNKLTSLQTFKVRVVIGVTTTTSKTYEDFPDKYENSDDETERYFAHMFVNGEKVNVKRAGRTFKRTYFRDEEGKFPTLNVEFECKGYGDKPKLTMACYRDSDSTDCCYVYIDRPNKESRYEHYRGQKYINLNNYAGNAKKMHVIAGFSGKFYGVKYKHRFPHFSKESH